MSRAAASIESRTVHKLRTRLLPFLFLLYVVAFLDRINIGFAALTMNKDLGITSAQFGLLTGIFFLGYFLFEVPSNVLLHNIGARVWIARILVSWGLIAVLTAFVRTSHQLYGLRFLLGTAEAGFFPGIVLYLTYWFRQQEQAQSIALFMTALPVATVVGSPMSGLILDHAHWLNLASWRWLLILEGVPAIACGVLTYLVLPNGPAEAGFLAAEEKQWLFAELEREDREKKIHRELTAGGALLHGRVWHLALIGFTLFVGMYAVIFWMPQTVKALSNQYSNTVVGLLVMIPYAVAVLTMVVVSRSSDRKLERRYHAAIPISVAAIALVLLGVTKDASTSTLLLGVVIVGGFSSNGPYWSLPSQFLSGGAAATGIALINSVANLGGFVGPYVIGLTAQKTGSLLAGMALGSVSFFVSAVLLLLLPKTLASEPRRNC